MEAPLTLLALAAVGCSSDPTSGRTGDPPDATHSGTTGCETPARSAGPPACPAFDPRPVVIQLAEVGCFAEGAVRLEVATARWTSGGILYTIATGAAQPRADEHDLESYEYDPCSSWDRLGRTLSVVDSPAQAVRNVTTGFACADHDSGLLTYAAAAWDIAGELDDCVVWGHDPLAVIEGAMTGSDHPGGPSFDASLCHEGFRDPCDD